MNTARLAVLGAATMLACSGFAHAAAGPLQAPVAIVAAQPSTAAMPVVGGPGSTYARGGNIVAVSDVASPSARSGWTTAPSTREPIYSIETGKASEAPLPGALWLFGSALLAFLGISARRRF